MSGARKVKRLEDFASIEPPRGSQTTRFSEEEINSFLAYDLSSKYHACLKSLIVRIEPTELRGVSVLDFDRLGMTSKKFFTKLIAGMFRGTHTLSMRGKVIAREGKAHFELEEAVFDDTSLPNFLVEEIISTVGKRQKPPFDPLQPSQMPYGIQRVDFYKGYMIVRQ
ncbi:MAG: hypothetical protein HXY20_03080 [Acidobacteria bacterium]|nr:hypothetical protein [Acidobacteriota bacterium]